MVGLGGSLKDAEPWDGWDGSVRKDQRAMEWLGWKGLEGWLGWKGPLRSKSNGIVGLEGSLKDAEP